MLSFPYGIRVFEPHELTKQWYEETIPLCVTSHSRNLARPIECKEYFKICGDTVQILDVYTYRYFTDSLDTSPSAVAPLPPPVVLASRHVPEITFDRAAVSLDFPTKYGPYYCVPDSTFCTYSLPIPEFRPEFPFHVPDSDHLKQLLHKDFDNYLRYYRDMEEIGNPGNYSFLFQHALSGKLFSILEEQDRIALTDMLQKGLGVVCDPDFQYTGPAGRRCVSWYQRTEPFTGVSYYSTYLHVSNICNFSHCDREVIENSDHIFIEVDWGNAMSLYGTWLAALLTGSWELIQKHWHVFRKAFDYYLVTMDWACMTAAYAENGVTWNDGTNYGGYLGFLNMARMLNKEDDQALALYAYAKMTAMRMGLFVSSQDYFCKYFDTDPWYTAKFFHEETDASSAFQSYPDDIVKNHYRGQSLYNMTTEGHYTEAMQMYITYLPQELEKTLQAAEGAAAEGGLSMTGPTDPPPAYHTRICHLLGHQEIYTYLMCSTLMNRFPEETLADMIEHATKNNRLSRQTLGHPVSSKRRVPEDWTYAMLTCALHCKNHPRICTWNNLHIRRAQYPFLEVEAADGAWLELTAKEMPRAILQNRPLVFRSCGKNIWRTDIPFSGKIQFLE